MQSSDFGNPYWLHPDILVIPVKRLCQGFIVADKTGILYVILEIHVHKVVSGARMRESQVRDLFDWYSQMVRLGYNWPYQFGVFPRE